MTGMSGTGKSSALAELGRRGFRVVDTDSPTWSEWAQDEWLWREDRMAELLAAEDVRPLFVSGCMSNQGKFYDRFEAVVLLSAPAEVILDRIEHRTTNDYGKTPAERESTVRALQARGAIFWQCNNALHGVAGRIGGAVNRPADEVYAELKPALNAGVKLIPAHTMLVGLAQEHGCAYESL